MFSPILNQAASRRLNVVIPDDGFVGDTLLQHWVRGGLATQLPGVLRVGEVGYLLIDALRILGPQDNDETDPYGMTGRVTTLRELIRDGAIIQGHSLKLGAFTYDVDYGYLVRPMGSADESGAHPRIR